MRNLFLASMIYITRKLKLQYCRATWYMVIWNKLPFKFLENLQVFEFFFVGNQIYKGEREYNAEFVSCVHDLYYA